MDSLSYDEFEVLCRETNLLLLSDLHYKKGSESRNREINELIVRRIKSFVNKYPDWIPHAICICGDLVDKGEEINYQYLLELLSELRSNFKLLKYYTFSTPGNHDINRERIVSSFDFLYSRMLDSGITTRMQSFSGSPVVDNIFDICSLPLEEFYENDLRLFRALSSFEKEYFKTFITNKAKINHFASGQFQLNDSILFETFYSINALGLNFTSVNSSFFSNFSSPNNDRNNLFLIGAVIELLRQRVMKISPILENQYSLPVVTIMHHPYFYLHESEHLYPEMKGRNLNNFQACAEFSEIILSGHTHGRFLKPILFSDTTYLISNGASCLTEEDSHLTLALIKINKIGDYFRIKPFNLTSEISDENDYEDISHLRYFQQKRNGIETSDFEEKSESFRIELVRSLANSIPEFTNKKSLLTIQIPEQSDSEVFFENFPASNFIDINSIITFLNKIHPNNRTYITLDIHLFDIRTTLTIVKILKRLIGTQTKYLHVSTKILYFV